MSKISRRQMQNRKHLDASKKNSEECREVMRANYARNLAMMENMSTSMQRDSDDNDNDNDKDNDNKDNDDGNGNDDSGEKEKKKDQDQKEVEVEEGIDDGDNSRDRNGGGVHRDDSGDDDIARARDRERERERERGIGRSRDCDSGSDSSGDGKGKEDVLLWTSGELSEDEGAAVTRGGGSGSGSGERHQVSGSSSSSPGQVKSPDGKSKEVNHEYLKACLASAEEQKKKQAEKKLRKRERAEAKAKYGRDYEKKDVSDSDGSSSDSEGSTNMDWLCSDEFNSDLPQVGVIDFTKKFRRDSINSFQHIEDAGDRSLCSTEDGDALDRTPLESCLHYMKKKIHQLEKYENLNRVIAIVLFYAIGVLVYSFLENWSVSDAVYFITISITTVGFGDMVPTNDVSKLFTMLYVLLGLVVIFSYVNYFAESMLLYAEDQAIKLAEKSNKRKRARQGGDAGDMRDVEGIPYTKYRRKMIFYIIMVVIIIFVGSAFYMYNENWSFVNALYFSFIATMTIGYGDPVLHNPSSSLISPHVANLFLNRTFSIFYVLFSVVIIAMALGNIGAIKLTIRQEKKKFDMLHKKLDLNSIIAMDDDGDGVDRIEFLTAMLMQMNGLSKEDDIDPWLKRFDELDKDGSGRLDQEDLRLFAEEEEIRKQTRREVRRLLEQKQQMSGMFSELIRGNSLKSLFDTDSDDEGDDDPDCKKDNKEGSDLEMWSASVKDYV